MTDNEEKKLRAISASSILIPVFTGAVVVGLSFILGLFNSSDIEARSDIKDLYQKHSDALERVNKVESRSQYNEKKLDEIIRGVEKLNDKIDALKR